jgi:Tfp pilus assembly major pilin PilA
MTLSPKRQQGLTLISSIFMLGALAVLILLALKIVPIYLDHSKVANALSALEKTSGVESLSEHEIRANLAKRFDLNYVYDVAQNDIKISKNGTYLKVAIQYEVAKKVLGNLSVLAEFNDVIEVGQQ